jgi:hypothetical protein
MATDSTAARCKRAISERCVCVWFFCSDSCLFMPSPTVSVASLTSFRAFSVLSGPVHTAARPQLRYLEVLSLCHNRFGDIKTLAIVRRYFDCRAHCRPAGPCRAAGRRLVVVHRARRERARGLSARTVAPAHARFAGAHHLARPRAHRSVQRVAAGRLCAPRGTLARRQCVSSLDGQGLMRCPRCMSWTSDAIASSRCAMCWRACRVPRAEFSRVEQFQFTE